MTPLVVGTVLAIAALAYVLHPLFARRERAAPAPAPPGLPPADDAAAEAMVARFRADGTRCVACGARLPADARFCAECGRAVGAAE